MWDVIVAFFSNLIGLDVAKYIFIVVAFNALLVGLRAFLEVIKDKTATLIDNKIYDFLGKIIDILLKIIDIVGANPKHK